MNQRIRRASLAAAVAVAALVILLAFAGVAGAGPAPQPPGSAAATVTGESPMVFGWAVQLRGALNQDLTYKAFRALAAAHPVTWVDDNKTPDDPSDDVTYTGVALWRLVALVDDKNPATFNTTLAAYSIQAIGLDGFTATYTSTDVAHNDGYVVADLANGAPLSMGAVKAGTPPSWRPAWPLKMCSATLPGNQKPAGIARIVVYKPGVTPPASPSTAPWAWILQLHGARSVDESGKAVHALAAKYPAAWVDNNKTPDDPSDDHTYTGLPLWRVLGLADDADAATFNRNLAGMDYPVTIIGCDGFTANLTSMQVAYQNGIVLADRVDGAQLSPIPSITDNGDGTYSWKPAWPAKICSDTLTGKQKPSGVLRVELGKPTYPAYSTRLTLVGKRTVRIAYAKFPSNVIWDGTKAGDINPTLKAVYRGQTLSKLVGLVDDKGPATFNKALALKGYKIRFICRDGYKATIDSKNIVGKKNWIVACLKDGAMLSADEGPYRYVGSFIKPFFGKLSASQVTEIKLIF
jgi:hypothetical protein